jgi:tRNA modification GTPase
VHAPERTREAARVVRREIERLLESEVAGGKLRRGIRVTIVGPRNVGKSSLYNALLGEERAIVSALPGTTRDLLRERIHVGGFTCYLEDTAGMAEAPCEIEAKGIEMGRSAALRADLVLFVLDGSGEIPGEARAELSSLDAARLLVVLNKMDLGLARQVAEARELLGGVETLAVSALTGEGLAALRERIYEKSVKRDASELAAERVAVNARQAAALRESDDGLERLAGLIDDGAPAELLAVEIRAALDALGKITGRAASEDLLEVIFTKFCIGK